MGFGAVEVSTDRMFEDGRSNEALAYDGRLPGSFCLRSSAKERIKDHGDRYGVKNPAHRAGL
jgi:hypothetical protein